MDGIRISVYLLCSFGVTCLQNRRGEEEDDDNDNDNDSDSDSDGKELHSLIL